MKRTRRAGWSVLARSNLAGCLWALTLVPSAAGIEVPGLERLVQLPAHNPLSEQWVRVITQDRHGFLWLGTISGVHRFDGYMLKSFANDPENPRSLPNNFVNAIYEDRDGVLWIATGGGLARLEGKAIDGGEFVTESTSGHFTSFYHDAEDPKSLSHKYVTGIVEDRNGELWVSTQAGVARLDRLTGTFTRFAVDPVDPVADRTYTAVRDRDDDLWFGGYGPALLRFDERLQTLEHHVLGNGPSADNYVWRIAEAGEGRLWAGTSRGELFRYDPSTGETESFLSDQHSRGFITSLHLWPDGSLWAGTDKEGVIVLDPESGAYLSYQPVSNHSGTVSAHQVSAIFRDRSDVVWLGTELGLDKYLPSRARFVLDRHRPEDSASLSGDEISVLLEDRRGGLWIGTSLGLDRMDRSGRVERRFRHNPGDPVSLPDAEILEVMEDSEGGLWLATSQGLGHFDPDRERFAYLDLDPADRHRSIETIYCLADSGTSVLWVGGVGGLDGFDRATGRSQHVELPRDVIDMAVGNAGELWLATYGAGLIRFTPADGGTSSFLPDADDGSNPNLFVSILREDSGALWIGTVSSGLYRFDPESREFTNYRMRDGLAGDVILDIVADAGGDLWLVTDQGLSRFDPETGTATNYSVEDGVPRALVDGILSSTGELLFASGEGLLRFRPEQLVPDPTPPAVAITDFLLLNRSTPFAARLKDHGEDGVSHLVLGHRDDIFAFEFAALHFAKPGKNRYRYMLEGFNRNWIETDAHNRFAQYTTLDAGEYTFRVTAANPDGVWNHRGATVRVTVLPPPWKTWWAYSLYALVVAAVMTRYVRSHRKELERERQVSHRLREVDKLKDEFLANTSHELRTPLYGMTGLAESLIDGATGELPVATKANLAMIVASGRRLGHLVNDILDFSKLRHKSLELDRRPVELHALVDVVLALLAPLVDGKDLRLENSVPSDLPAADGDENRLQQILHNLIGNAVKFTDEGFVEISAAQENGRLAVRVRDTGIGIEPEQQERIFDAFEQADGSVDREYGGTGLGLAVTRQLVELHGGTIQVESSVGEGSTFTFDLPVAEGSAVTRQEESARPLTTIGLPEPFLEVSSPEDSLALPNPDAIRILAVDDEPVNLQVLKNYLAVEHFDLVTAASGEEALGLIEEQHFDLVLLDVMMPKVSGFEVCRALREKYPKESLPVLFLTAKNQSADVVTGLSLGANDFLTKPVAKDELLARLRPHLDLLETHRHLEDLVAEKMSEIKVLEGILPICSGCKKIRDDVGNWAPLETYIDSHSEAHFSHGICPDCVKEYYYSKARRRLEAP